MFTLELDWDRPNKISSDNTTHFLRLRINPPTTVINPEGIPLRMAIALDTSSSMTGEKIAKAKEACHEIIKKLRPQDKIFLASYNTQVTTILDNISDQNKALTAINEVKIGGVTRTDLALDWLQTVLSTTEKGVAKVGILITDGNATNNNGTMLTDFNSLILQGETISNSGIIIDTVGLGNAANFNSDFLNNLSEKGKGKFIYADNITQLQSLVTERLQTYQSVAVEGAKLTLIPSKNVKYKGFCCINPDFLPLEESKTNELILGAIRSNSPTDILIGLEIPAADFGESSGEKEIIKLEFIPSENAAAITAKANINYTTSFNNAQKVNREIDQQRLKWEINNYSTELNRTNDPQKTGLLLVNMQVTATKLGNPDLVKNAAEQYDNLQKTGKLTPHQTTKLLTNTRNLNTN